MRLFPILDEGDGGDESLSIAVALDHFKFFHDNLWRSWDAGDDECEDWVGEHLANRFHLYREFLAEGETSKNWTRMLRLDEDFKNLQNQV
jgi:hypothetical protein